MMIAKNSHVQLRTASKSIVEVIACCATALENTPAQVVLVMKSTLTLGMCVKENAFTEKE